MTKFRCITVALIVCIVQLLYTFYKNHFVFAYGLDDAYIHLAIAKHFAENGVWGVTKYGFTSATSSPLYTFILACIIKIIGNKVWIPIIINIGAVIGIFYVSADYLYFGSPLPWQRIKVGAGHCPVPTLKGDILTIFLTLITPIPFLIISGMEHTLHILGIILLIRAIQNTQTRQILIYSFLSVTIRYETMFLILGIALMYMYIHKEIKLALSILFAGFIPILIWGIISINNGAYFFPNPLLIKSTLPSLDLEGIKTFASQVYDKLKTGMTLNCLMAWLFLYIFTKKQEIQNNHSLLFAYALLITIFLHSILAGNFIVSRYESYMVFGVLLFTLPYMVEKLISNRSLLLTIACLFAFFPFSIRLLAAIPLTNVCVKNIYEQQIQIAKFLQTNYPKEKIIAQDIGAISYYTDVAIFDLIGLSTNEVIQYKNDKPALVKHLQTQPHSMAILWEENQQYGPNWKYVGKWTISENMICAEKDVYFWAKDTTLAPDLKQKLQNYSDKHRDLFEASYSE